MRHRICVLVGGLALVGAMGSVSGDTLKLKDGAVLEGDLIEETATGLTFNAEFADGTIRQTRIIPKADLVEVRRSTLEEQEVKATYREYRELSKHQLEPSTTLTLRQYEQVIQDVFRKFLNQHPNSTYRQEVEQKIAQWQAERDQAATGKVKYQGNWLPSDEAARLLAGDQAEQTLQRARTLIRQQKYSEANTELKSLSLSDLSPSFETLRRDLLREAQSSWTASLEQKLRLLEEEHKHMESRLQHAGESVNRTRENLRQFKCAQGTQGNGIIGYQGMLQQHESAVQRAESEQMQVDRQLAQLREEQAIVKRLLTELQTQPGAPAVSSDESQTPVSRTNPVEVLTSLWMWGKENWILAVGGVLAAMFLLTRLFR